MRFNSYLAILVGIIIENNKLDRGLTKTPLILVLLLGPSRKLVACESRVDREAMEAQVFNL